MRALALLTVLSVTAATVVAAVDRAEAEEPAQPEPGKAEARERIAGLLYERGMKLYEAEMWADAKALFEESLARSPEGPKAVAAREMIGRCEVQLAGASGASEDDADEPHPGAHPAPADDQPLDPYAEDPPPRRRKFARAPRKWLMPVLRPAAPGADRPSSKRMARNLLMVFGGVSGAGLGAFGYRLAAGEDETEAAALPIALGGAALGGITAWLVVRNRTIREADAWVTILATAWAGLLAGAVVNLFDDPTRCASCIAGAEDVSGDVYYAGAALGGAAGLTGAILFARRYQPSTSDVWLTNSLVAYGMGAGIFLGVIMQPSQDRAYTFNAAVGAGIGLGAGLYLARRAEISSKRVWIMMAGAAFGAITGYYVVGGLIDRDDSSQTDEQIRGVAGLVGIGAGALLTWTFTRGERSTPAKLAGGRAGRAAAGDPAPPALVMRRGDGRWGWGGLVPAAYATAGGGSALGVSLVSGRF